MKIWNLALASLALLPLSAVHANTSIDNANRFTGGLLLQSTPYDADGYSEDADGQILVAGYKAAINPRFAIGGGIGLMIDGEFGHGNKLQNVEGFRLFGDAQLEVHRFDKNKIIATGTLSHDRFSFSRGGIDLDFTVTELKIGGVIMHDVRDFSLYGGLELVIYSHGDFDNGKTTTDIHRDDRLNLRLGASFKVTRDVDIRADLLLVGEQTILLAADFAI